MNRWWLVAGLFVVLMISSGFGFYNLSVYMNALSQERGFAVADLSGAIGMLFIVSGIAGVGVARLIAVYDVRWVMVGGAVIGGAALSLIGSAQEIWQIWVLYALFGIGISGVSLIPGTTIVTRFFPGAGRSVALSITSTGLSAGGVVLTPACAAAVHAFGLESVMPWFGAVFFLGVAPVALFMVRSWPDGPSAAARVPSGTPALALRALLMSRFFLGSTCAYILLMGAQVGGIAHLFNHVDKVSGHVVASSCISLLAMSSIVGRLVGGVVATWFPLRAFILLNTAGQCAGLLVLAYASGDLAMLVGAAIFGVTVGNLLMLQPLLMAESYGVHNYARVYSIAYGLTALGVASGPLGMGILHDWSGYTTSFTAAAVCTVVAFFVFASAGALPVGDSVEASGTKEVTV
ncbi:MAG: MFS transporter [Gammaproteobacteria bacterium]|nr:MFS transporter [Gammaproteobacteria bacterium]